MVIFFELQVYHYRSCIIFLESIISLILFTKHVDYIITHFFYPNRWKILILWQEDGQSLHVHLLSVNGSLIDISILIYYLFILLLECSWSLDATNRNNHQYSTIIHAVSILIAGLIMVAGISLLMCRRCGYCRCMV
jgi:nitrate reductase gamma subunit